MPLSFWNMEIRHRIGTFFHLVGLTLMLIFFASILSKGTNMSYLFLSFVAFFIGFILRRNKPVQDSGRFSYIRKAGQHSHERRAGKMNKIPRGKPARSGRGIGKTRHEREPAIQESEEGTVENQQE